MQNKIAILIFALISVCTSVFSQDDIVASNSGTASVNTTYW